MSSYLGSYSENIKEFCCRATDSLPIKRDDSDVIGDRVHRSNYREQDHFLPIEWTPIWTAV